MKLQYLNKALLGGLGTNVPSMKVSMVVFHFEE